MRLGPGLAHRAGSVAIRILGGKRVYDEAAPTHHVVLDHTWEQGKSLLPRVVVPSRAQQHLDCTTLVHRPVGLCHLFKGQGQVEHLAGVDAALNDAVDEIG